MLFDLAVLAGFILVGVAVYLVFGVPAAVAVAGLTLIVVGTLGAWWKARQKVLVGRDNATGGHKE